MEEEPSRTGWYCLRCRKHSQQPLEVVRSKVSKHAKKDGRFLQFVSMQKGPCSNGCGATVTSFNRYVESEPEPEPQDSGGDVERAAADEPMPAVPQEVREEGGLPVPSDTPSESLGLYGC